MKALTFALVVALCTSGCAAAFTKPVPKGWDGASVPACSTSNGWGRLDALGAVASGLVAVIIFTDDSESAHSFGNQGYYALVPMVGYGASSIYGWQVTKKCRHARAAVAP